MVEGSQTHTDAQRRTQTNADAHRQTQTNARQTVSCVWADTTSRRVQTLDVCSRTFWTYYKSNVHSISMGDEIEEAPQRWGWQYLESCNILLNNTPTSHPVSLALLYTCTHAVILRFFSFLLLCACLFSASIC